MMMNAKALSFGFVGAGRFGTGLAWALADHGYKVNGVASRTMASAQRCAARIGSCQAHSAARVQTLIDSADIILVTTPDAEIERVVSAADWSGAQAVVHCSGVTEVSALAKAASDGARIGGFHPLQAFSDAETAMRALPGSTVTIEAEEPLLSWLTDIAESLACKVNQLPPGARGRYHAAGSYAAQFLNVLMGEAAAVWHSWGAKDEDAVRALLPLMRGTLDAIEAKGIANGMPGPVTRGDVETIAKHIDALHSVDPRIVTLYRHLCRRAVPLAVANGGIDQSKAKAFTAALDQETSEP